MSDPVPLEIESDDGLHLRIWDHGGDGPPVVFCHCTGGLGRQWDPIIERIDGDWHCFAVDTRGHGDSEVPEHLEAIDWHNSGRDLLRIVDNLQLEGACAIGHSAGAAHIAFAEHLRPGVFQKVVLIDGIVGPPVVEEHGARLADQVRNRVNTFSSRSEARARFETKKPMSRWHPEMLDAYVQHAFQDTEDGVTLKCPGDREAHYYIRAGVSQVFAELESMPVKSLIVTADGSGVRPLAVAQHELMPHAELRVVEGGTHFVPQEKPDEIAALIQEWLSPP